MERRFAATVSFSLRPPTSEARRDDDTTFSVGVWDLRCLAVRVAVRLGAIPAKLHFADC